MTIVIPKHLVALALLSLSLSAQADCPFPKGPESVPDGKTATEDEMKSAAMLFKAYNEQVTSFGTCLDQESKANAAGSTQRMQFKTMQSKKVNAAIEELETKAKLFNEQVRIFKGR